MWPKALLELLPHLTKLVPTANRYFQAKATGDDTTRIALERKLEAVAASLRNDLQDTTGAHAELSKRLSDQTRMVTELSADVHHMRAGLEGLTARMERLEQRSAKLTLVVVLALVQTFIVCVLLVLALVQMHSGIHVL